MSDPRTVLHLDPTRFLSDGDAYVPAGINDDDNVCHDDPGEYDADADLHASWEIAR